MMAKKIKKLLAVTLAVSMCMSMFSLPSFAATTSNTQTSTDPVTGNTTSTTTTTETWGPTGGDDADSVVSGSETTVNTTVTDKDGNIIEKSGSVSGSETTTTTTTHTETKTYEDVLFEETTENNMEANPDLVPDKPQDTSSTDTPPTWNLDSTTEDVPPTEENPNAPEEWDPNSSKWTEGDLEWDDVPTDHLPDSELEDEENIKIDNGDPLDTKDIVIKFEDKNNDGEIDGFDANGVATKTVTEEISIEDVIAGNVTIPKPSDITNDDGSRTIVKVTKETDPITGDIIGYKVTTITVDKDADLTSETANGEAVKVVDPIDEDKAISEYVWAELPEGVEEQEEHVVPQDDENKVVTEKTEIAKDEGEDGKKTTTVTKTTKTVTTEVIEEVLDKEKDTIVTTTLPEKPQESENTTDGVTTKVTVEDILDEDTGEVIGYKTITEKTDADGNVLYSGFESTYGTTTTRNITYVVDPITKKTTITTTVVLTETQKYSAQKQTVKVGVETTQNVDVTKDVNTTTDHYQLIATDDGYYYVFEGKMYKVKEICVEGAENNHGVSEKPAPISYDQVKENYTGAGWATATDDIQGAGDGSTNYSWYMAYTDEQLAEIRKDMKKGNFVLVGYGLFSEYEVYDDRKTSTNSTGAHSTKQYVVMDHEGNFRLTYCVELGKGLQFGGDHNPSDTLGEWGGSLNTNNLYQEIAAVGANGQGSVEFKEGTDAEQYITSIATNGFWGTDDGQLGSLQAVKDLLIREGYSEVAESLTAGQALAATQAAIWKYGNAGKTYTMADLNNYIKEYYYNHDPSATTVHTSAATSTEYRNIETLFTVLTSLAQTEKLAGVNAAINKEDITSTAIVIKDKSEGKTENSDKNKDNDIYDANIQFTLAVSSSAMNGDLLVHVYLPGSSEPVMTKRLAGVNTGEQSYGKIYPDQDGTYTIEGLQLQENVKVTLKLDGTQHLTNGVYVYECANSQNFVGGLATYDQNINLEFGLEFSVDEPEISHKRGTASSDLKGTRQDSREDERTYTRNVTTTEISYEQEASASHLTQVYAEVTVTEVTTETQSSTRTWSDSWKETFDPEEKKQEQELVDNLNDGQIPLGGQESQGEELDELLEDEIPLAAVPKTGDMSVVWYAMTVLSGAGLAGMSIFGKKKEDEEV